MQEILANTFFNLFVAAFLTATVIDIYYTSRGDK
jgi:hypothetical protein